ncbi:diguanylate cyclase (GGDEF) domain-containing protein [Sphingomonas guangdongensis]|uniref:Diguanylate cyclase (GGDEF) domain-containing protein n=1 Tax=Sphingomonas guangdongensis TaxID=1141890 RepID=A0A285R7H0_9SPHN|nr:EAL domain-containing protein [Sphingomonas guangdongensis]SOB88307.1 diguanylate cyclase (GGDEF) domain-containing protein [Sphingomonas guangdongensis]
MSAITPIAATLERAVDLTTRLSSLERRLTRERQARLEAEGVAEQGLRDLYVSKQRLSLLEKVAAIANESDTATQAIGRALAEVCGFTGWACGHAFVRGEQPGTLVSAGLTWTDDRADLEPFIAASTSAAFDVGVGLPGRALASRAPEWIRDVGEVSNFLRQAVALRCGLRAAFAFPVMISDRCEAVLEFFSRECVEPDWSLIDLMQQVGTQLGRVLERERMAKRLAHEAHHDALTGLLNRRTFALTLDQVLARVGDGGTGQIALVLLDIDEFRLINDMVGHATADRLLAGMPATIRRVCAELRIDDRNYHLARIGADEFAVLVEGERLTIDPAHIGSALKNGVKALSPSGWTFEASVCAGIALAGRMLPSGEEMLRDASTALRTAKARGRGQVVLFDGHLREQTRRRVLLERDLRAAIAAGELSVGYQPIVRLCDDQVSGVEALARWTRTGDAVSPAEFIPIAEETGLIVPLGEWILREACRTIAAANKRRLKPLSVSVNVSPQQFLEPAFGARVLEVLRTTGLPPKLLRLEITESVAMQDMARTRAVLGDLCAAQVRVSLDDFGTGFSSLNYLSRLPVDTLKIDRSFIDQLAGGEEGQAIVRAILELGRALSMDVIAEGIERPGQAAFLREHGCSHGQGFLFGKAMASGEVQALADGVPAKVGAPA